MSANKVQAGTLESNDIYLTLEEKPKEYGIQINLQSIVLAQFGKSIKETIMNTINASGVNCGLEIIANDKGALTCTIDARVKTALSRAGLLKESAK